MNTIKLGQYTVFDPIKGIYCNNSFEAWSGARAGMGRFLVANPTTTPTGIQISQTITGPINLEITSDIEQSNFVFKGTHSVTIPVHILGFQPVQQDNEDFKSDLYEVLVADRRCELEKSNFIGKFNCQRQSEIGLEYNTKTISGGTTAYTWADIVSAIASAGNCTIKLSDGCTYLTSTPKNLCFSGSVADAIEIVAAHNFLIVGYNFTNHEIIFYNPIIKSTNNATLITKYLQSQILFGPRGNTIRNTFSMPKEIEVVYPKIPRFGVVLADDQPYKVTIEVNSKGNGKKILHLGNYVADIKSDGTVANQTELDNIASYIAQRAWDIANVDIHKEQWGLTIPFELDGNFRCIKWVAGKSGHLTSIMHGNTKASDRLQEIEKNIEWIANSTVSVFDGDAFGTPNGKMIIAPRDTRTFWAKITASQYLSTGMAVPARGPKYYNQYEYTFEEVYKIRTKYSQPGFASWSAVQNGRTGKAYNTIEDINKIAINNGGNNILGSGDVASHECWRHWTDGLAGHSINQILTVTPVIEVTDGNMNTVDVAGPDGARSLTLNRGAGASSRTVTPFGTHTSNDGEEWVYGALTTSRIITQDILFGQMHPCPVGNIVRMIETHFIDTASAENPQPTVVEYWFAYENSIEMTVEQIVDICADASPQPVVFTDYYYATP